MPKKKKAVNKKKNETEIFIKVKNPHSKKTFWEGIDFDEEKTNKIEPEKKKQIKTVAEGPKKAEKKIVIGQSKKGKMKYVLIGILTLAVLLLIYFFFIVRPAWAASYQQKGDKAIQNQEITYALENYQKALALTPRSSSLNSKIAKIYQEKGMNTEAKKYAEGAISLNLQNKDAYLVLGQVYLVEKKYDEAYKNLKKVADANIDSPDIYIGLEKSLITQNKLDEAKSLAEKSFLLYPDNPEILYNLSLVWTLNQNYNEAIKGFEKLENNSNFSDKAKAGLDAISVLQKNDIETSYKNVALGNFYNQADLPEKAIPLFNLAISKVPTYRDAYLGLAESYILQNNYQEAEKALKKAEDIDSVYGLSYYLQGKIYQKQNQNEKALQYFVKASERGYDNVIIRKEMAEIYTESGAYKEALAEYQKALIFKNDDLGLYERIVWLLAEKMNEPQEALEKAKGLNNLKPNNALVYNILAEAYMANNQIEEAKKELEQAISKDPTLALTYYNLGLVYQKQENSNEAKKYFIKAADYDTEGNIFNQAYRQLKNL